MVHGRGRSVCGLDESRLVFFGIPISKLGKDVYGHMSLWQGSKCIATSEIIAADLYVHMNIGGMVIFMYYYQCFQCL